MLSTRTRLIAAVLAVGGLAVALFLAASFPAVEGLGTKVRLPVFHGALTWVNLAAFALLGVVAVIALITRNENAYRWSEALRWTAVPLWIIGTVLGLLAALNTWDFSGSKSSRLEVVAADPRLMAQFWILLAGLALLALGLMVDDRRWLSVFDVGFVVIAWTLLMQAVLGPGRALHPDSPVLNSEEIGIKLLFFGMVISLGVATVATAWLITQVREGKGSAGGNVVDVPAITEA